MKRIHIQTRGARRDPSWHEELPLDSRDEELFRAKALARAAEPDQGPTDHAVRPTRDSRGLTVSAGCHKRPGQLNSVPATNAPAHTPTFPAPRGRCAA
jgi:hypothetical protein